MHHKWNSFVTNLTLKLHYFHIKLYHIKMRILLHGQFFRRFIKFNKIVLENSRLSFCNSLKIYIPLILLNVWCVTLYSNVCFKCYTYQNCEYSNFLLPRLLYKYHCYINSISTFTLSLCKTNHNFGITQWWQRLHMYMNPDITFRKYMAKH
jgi:hypothetical protein